MFDEKTEQKINEAVTLEIVNAVKRFGADYNSNHEAYAVLLEEVEDSALGNGGLGRLAACFLESAATHNIALDGYGIRYKYGLFKQAIVDGRQIETPDDWLDTGRVWLDTREDQAVEVLFGGTVKENMIDGHLVSEYSGYNNKGNADASPILQEIKFYSAALAFARRFARRAFLRLAAFL